MPFLPTPISIFNVNEQLIHYLSASFAVKLFLVGCLVEVQVSTKNLIGSLTRDHHLNPQRLNLTGHKKHRGASSNGRNIISFNVVNNILYCINTVLLHTKCKWFTISATKKDSSKLLSLNRFLYRYLNSEIKLVVNGSQIVCNFFCSLQIRRTLLSIWRHQVRNL